MNTYVIKEEGKNGSVELVDGKLVRTIKHRIGRDDLQSILIKSITDVAVNRRLMGSDIVTITLGNAKSYVWKTPHAEELAALVLAAVQS